MASGAVKLEGLKELNKALKQLEGRVAQRYTRRGIAKMAQVIRREMRQRAPRDTGELRRGLVYKIRRQRDRTGFTGRVGVRRGLYYAAFIEYGTEPHRVPAPTVGRGRHKTGNRARVKFDGRVYSAVTHPGTPPRPFLRPAFEASREQAVKEAGAIMWKLIKQGVK